MNEQKDQYFVAVKIFLRDTDGRLFIFKDKFGAWDLPGGRLLPNEFNTPLRKVVERKILEELGNKIKYQLGEPAVHMRHERNEYLADGSRGKRRIFAVGYQATYIGGKIGLGKNHVKHEWVALDNFKPERYFEGGWLKGVKEYLKYNK